MLEEKNPLPRAESHLPSDDWNDLAGAGKRHADVARHIIRALLGMDEPWCVFRNEFFKKHLKISPRTGVSILHDHQAGAGVLHENGDDARLNFRPRDDRRHLSGDFNRALAVSPYGKLFAIACHGN